jgi:hypothetical protein
MKTNTTTNGQIVWRGEAVCAIALTFSLILSLPAHTASADDLSPSAVASPVADVRIAIDRDAPPNLSRETASGGGALSSGGRHCPGEWSTTFNDPGLSGETIYALAVYEGDLYAGGTFTSAGGQTVNHIARWGGESWNAVGGGVNGIVRTMLVHDGSLYVGGHFSSADDQTANHIARWDGEHWHAVGDGFNNAVMTMAVHDGALVAGGMFTHSGEMEVNFIALLDQPAGEWQPLGSGMNRSVLAVTSYDGYLVAGGHFTEAGSEEVGRLAIWFANQWLPISDGLLGSVRTMLSAGNVLLAGGALQGNLSFPASPYQGDGEHAASPTNQVVQWDWFPSPWEAVGPFLSGSAQAIHQHEGQLFAAGRFTRLFDESATLQVNLIAQWDGETWQPLGEGLGGMYNGSAEAMTTYNGKFIVAGYFATAGGEPATSIAAWDAPPFAGPGDINCDGVVDGADLLLLLSAWGECTDPDDCPADLDGDGVVDGADLLILLANWG